MDFIKKLWNGEYPLAQTYWLYGFLVNFAVWVFISIFSNVLSANMCRLILALLMIYQFILWVATWRAANKYTGNSLWKYLAKIAVVFGIIYVYNFITNFNF